MEKRLARLIPPLPLPSKEGKKKKKTRTQTKECLWSLSPSLLLDLRYVQIYLLFLIFIFSIYFIVFVFVIGIKKKISQSLNSMYLIHTPFSLSLRYPLTHFTPFLTNNSPTNPALFLSAPSPSQIP